MDNMDRISDRDRLERNEQGIPRGEQKSLGDKNKGNNSGLKKKILIVSLVLIVILMYMGLRGTSNVKWENIIRTWNMTNEQGIAAIFNSIQEIENINENLGIERGFYERNRLYHDAYLLELFDKEYLVYVFTGDMEKDKEFDAWVRDNDLRVQIFKIHIDDITTNLEVMSYIDADKKEPMMLVYNEIERGKKNLEGVIKDPALLDEARDYINKLIDEKLQR